MRVREPSREENLCKWGETAIRAPRGREGGRDQTGMAATEEEKEEGERGNGNTALRCSCLPPLDCCCLLFLRWFPADDGGLELESEWCAAVAVVSCTMYRSGLVCHYYVWDLDSFNFVL